MFKKRLIPLMLAALCSQTLFAQTISINDTKIEATEIDSTIYVPLRSVAKQLNETVAYNDGVSVIFKDGIVYAINSKDSSVMINDLKANKKDVGEISIQVVDGITYIPLETFSDIFKVSTSYNEETGDIEISQGGKSNNYAGNLKNSIKVLEELIAKTTDKEKLLELTSNRDLLVKAYMEHKGYATFGGDYTGEEKKQLIDNILKDIKEITGSSLNTSRPARSSSDDIKGIGEIPKLVAIYSVKGYDKKTGRTAYIVGGRYMPTGRYYGGSVDFGVYANGIPIMVTGHNFALDTDQYIGKLLGLGNTGVDQPLLDTKGIDLDVDEITSIQFKTNIFGDFDITYNANGEFVYGDPAYFDEVKKGFSGFINFDPPPQTTESVYNITF